LQGTNLSDAILDDLLRVSASKREAIRGPSRKEREQTELLAIVILLEERNTDDHLDFAIASLMQHAQHFASDPSYLWHTELHTLLNQQASPDDEQEAMKYIRIL